MIWQLRRYTVFHAPWQSLDDSHELTKAERCFCDWEKYFLIRTDQTGK